MVYHFGHDCDLPSITRCTFVIDPRTVRILEPYAWPKIKIENKKIICHEKHRITYMRKMLYIENQYILLYFYVTFSECPYENKHVYISCAASHFFCLFVKMFFFLPLWLIVMHILCFSLYMYYYERLYI